MCHLSFFCEMVKREITRLSCKYKRAMLFSKLSLLIKLVKYHNEITIKAEVKQKRDDLFGVRIYFYL